MKKIILSLVLVSSLIVSAQNEETVDKIDKDGNLIGVFLKDDLLVEPFNDWFSFNYDDYSADEEIVKKLKPLLRKVKIKAFMGTWCGDSQEQVPVFYKILDAADFNYKNLEFIGVNRSKKTPDNLQEGLDIERVPTYIFYKENQEIGRFVEYPRETVEADILKIVSGEPYKHSYEEE